MCPGIFAVGANSGQRGTFGLLRDVFQFNPAHMGAEGIAGGEHTERLAVVRFDGNGLFQQVLRDGMVLPGDPPVIRQGMHHQIPGIEAARRLAPDPDVFRRV